MSASNKPTRANENGVALRRLWQRFNELAFSPGAITQTSPRSDPAASAAGANYNFYQSPRWLFGVITDTTAIANTYRVQFGGPNRTMACAYAPSTSLSAGGVRELTTLQPGTTVLCVIHHQNELGYIIAAIPPATLASNRQILQHLHHSTRNRVDEGHKFPLRMTDNGMIADVTGGRLFDSTTVGEAGWITETGVRIFIDPFMASLGVDEACGITAFFHDQMLRIAAYNHQMFTAGSERLAVNDEEEYHDWEGFTPYVWELIGMFERLNPMREVSPRDWQITNPANGPWEPAAGGSPEPRLQGWHRQRYFRGYLGQGGKYHVSGPPMQPASCNTFAGGRGEKNIFTGLFDQSVGLDGRFMLSSAKGISIVKRLGIVSPQRLRTPDNVKEVGDNQKNYKAAGIVGDGPEHTITGDLATDSNYPAMQRASGILDLHAYLFNYAAVHPFFWHTKDWKIEEEAKLPHTAGGAIEVPNFAALSGTTFLPPPTPRQLKIDHRYGEQQFFPNESGLAFLDDGGVVLYDGFGSEIKMTAGSVMISSPGDVWYRAGRNVLHWGGRDVIVRAKNSVDITCSDADLRLKAEKNLHILGGNSGTGGVLIESRANGAIYDFENKIGEHVVSGGVMLRAAKSEVVAWGQNIYLRTGGGDINPGTIMLDADKGGQDVTIASRFLMQYVDQSALWFFGKEGNIRKANEFSENWATISTGMCVNDVMLVDGDILNKGWLLAAQGHVVTEYAPMFSFFVGPLQGQALAAVNEAVEECHQRAEFSLPQVGGDYWAATLTSLFYLAARPGNDDVIRNAQFSLRSLEQYKTQNFAIFEDRWQQMARLSGQVSGTWTEKPVACPADPETYPWPGKDNFIGAKLYQQELTMMAATGTKIGSKDRGTDGQLTDAYKNPKYGNTTPVTLNGNYAIIQ